MVCRAIRIRGCRQHAQINLGPLKWKSGARGSWTQPLMPC
jgi:hypothetical protein